MENKEKIGVGQLKRFIVLLSLISVIAVLSACSTKTSLELIEPEVDIINDKERTGSMTLQQGEKAGQEVVPTSLYYTFTIKNEGNKKIGNTTESVKEKIGNTTEGLKVKIEPNEKLLTVSNEVMGFNIFNPTEYENSGLGYGQTSIGVLEPNGEVQYVFIYELGINEETTEALLAPSKEQLDKLKTNAMEATLIVSFNDEEIARFDLSKKE